MEAKLTLKATIELTVEQLADLIRADRQRQPVFMQPAGKPFGRLHRIGRGRVACGHNIACEVRHISYPRYISYFCSASAPAD